MQFNGSVTQTHALPDGDKDNSAGCADDLVAPIVTDQRGDLRPYGPHCDIGAFEAADIIFRNGFQ